jgi:hypothetical protein
MLRKKVRQSVYDTTEETHTLGFKLKKIDYVGLVLFLGTCICIILALVWGGSTYPWRDARIIVLLILGVLFLITFILTEWLLEPQHKVRIPGSLQPILSHATPMIPLDLFRNWDVVICHWNNLTSGMAMYGQFYYIAIYFTIVFEYKPAQAGQQLLYFLPGLGVGAWSALFFVRTVFHGTKVTFIAGAVVTAVAVGLFSSAAESENKPQLFGFMAMLGVGVGLVPLKVTYLT